jgi:hypothetical protein
LSKLATFVAAATLALGAGACASSSGATTGTRGTRSPDLISKADIEATQSGNAYDLVNRLRPQWLRTSGVGSVSGGNPATYGLVVFLDNVRLGGVETLRSVDSGSITSIRFLTAERAASTLPAVGRDPISGAIVISTR